jgi:hypothetical protein
MIEIENKRGWIGVAVFVAGILMLFSEQTRPVAFVAIGFGLGMMSSGFQ